MFRWLQSRTARKFFRNRLAVLASVVVLIYIGIAVYLVIGELRQSGNPLERDVLQGPTVTLDDTELRFGMQTVPAFYLGQEPEKRLEDVEIKIEEVERALAKVDAERALGDVRYGMVRVADKSPSELQAIVDRAWSVYDQLATSEDLNADPNMLAQLEQLEEVTAELFQVPAGRDAVVQNLAMLLGTDRQGRSILLRGIYSIKVAVLVGVISALVSVLLGSLLGALAGFFGGWVDHVVVWLYTTFSSIPNLVLLVLLAYLFTGVSADSFGGPLAFVGTLLNMFLKPGQALDQTLIPVYVAFCSTFWIGPCRVIRGETLKLKELDYIHAAKALGLNRIYILLRHILPNVSHLMLVNFSLLFIAAIKSEVILSFLGLGVKRGPSWGIMISQAASEVVVGFFWQIGAATAFMFVLVLAFNILSDSLQDVLDPRHL